MKKIFYIFLITQLTVGVGYSQWFWVNPYPVGSSINSVKFVNSNTGYFATEGGSIVKTTNACDSLIFQKSGLGESFKTLFFINDSTGFAGGIRRYSAYSWRYPSGLIYKTTNGGRYWEKIFSDTSFFFSSLFFLNQDVGYSVGINYNIQYLSKTNNGGKNWIRISFDTSLVISALYFFNENTGMVTGYLRSTGQSAIIRTSNGGNSWSRTTLVTYGGVTSIQFVNQNTGFAASGKIMKSTNGGLNWYKVNNYDCRFISFLNENTGIAVQNALNIYKTTNGGTNWTTLQFPSTGIVQTCSFPDNDHIYLACNDGSISRSTDGGANWRVTGGKFTNAFLYSLYSLNKDTLFIAGDRTILRSYNRGKTWYVKNFTDSGFSTVCFFNAKTGIAVGGYDPMFRTTDGGNNWNFLCPSLGHVWMLSFPDEKTGYAAGRWNNILKTTNSGSTWTKMPTEFTSYHHQSVQFINVNTGYTASEYGKVHKTTDGGWTWNVVYSAQSDIFLYSVYFSSERTGFAVGGTLEYRYPFIITTTDSGHTWRETTLSEGSSLHCVRFFNTSVGYGAGDMGTILCTTNGGVNWQFQPSGTNAELYSVICLDSLTALACGMDGTILKTTNGGFSIEEKPPEKIIPINYYLYQNYPNPFNPLTKIRFDLPADVSGNIRLAAYDILGRLVSVIFDGAIGPGTYEFIWNGTNYSSGVYFYQLRTDKFTEAKKMVLIR